jgi:ribonuclease HI
MYFDGTLNLEGAGAGVLLIPPQGEQLKYVLWIHYKAFNNGAEYKALIHGLHIAMSLGIKQLLAFGDSMVLIEQVNKSGIVLKTQWMLTVLKSASLKVIRGDRVSARATKQ